MADPIPPEILIVGQPRSGAASLVQRLFPTQGASAAGDATFRPAVIGTKYYTASVQLRYLDPSSDLSASSSEHRDFGDGGLLLAFSALEESSFDSVKSWVAGHNTETAGVCLCIATHVDSLVVDKQQDGPVEAQRPAWLDAAIDWCSGQGFEYIECCLDDPELDSRLRLDGDVQGLNRISEALTAHMWPGLIRKSSPAAEAASVSLLPGGGSAAATASEPASDNTNSSAATFQPQPSQQQQEAPATGGHKASQGNKGSETEDEERRLEEHIEKMDALMADMAAAKSVLGQLPDEERRAKAAELALRFAALLGDDDDDSEGESSLDREEE